MRFAIYSRKSKFTGKGESIGNQIEECKRYIMSRYPDTEEKDIFIYEDEGYSGKNTNRPQFQQMMISEEEAPFDFIIVYRLDRISRNMADFAILMDKLTKKGTSFYSTNEGFDTSTLSGKMMMTISAAFAQFERQIIAERVKDNVYKLAKTGRWLGGTPPLGFYSERVELVDETGDDRKFYRLTENEEEIAVVQLIYARYLETHSITKVSSFMLRGGYKTRKNSDFHISVLRYILTNPTYCTADKKAFYFFRDKGCDMDDIEEKCDGKLGFIGYKKTRTKSDDCREGADISDWTIALGRHRGIITSTDWIEVQNIIEGNSEKKIGFRQPHNSSSLLSGVIRCKCGSYMRPKYYKENKDGEKPFSYMCELKEKSKRKLCGCTNVNGRIVDEMVCDVLISYEIDSNIFGGYIRDIGTENKNQNTENLIKNRSALIAKKKKTISGLLRLAEDNDRLTAEYIRKEIARIHNEIRDGENEIKRLEGLKNKEKDLTDTEEILKAFKSGFKKMSVENKRAFIRKCVRRVEWDGENISVFLYDE